MAEVSGKVIDPRKFVRLCPGVVWRGLETPHLFHLLRDELYELDESGLEFIEDLDLNVRAGEITRQDILHFALDEGLVELCDQPADQKITRGMSPVPSLRYLETMLTYRCNLRCNHCYLGETRTQDLAVETMDRLAAEFDTLQGLRMLLSGGEPLMHPEFEALCDLLRNRGFRVVLLSNGLLLDERRLSELPAQEVQLSIDGLRGGHDALRGPGSFDRVVAAARLVSASGRDLSVATMIHPANLEELDGLSDLVHQLGAREWSLELPSAAGRWSKGQGVPPGRAAAALALGFGGSYHGSAAGHACGYHLASLTPGGDLCPCGFYADAPLGNIMEVGLAAAWAKKKVSLLSEIETCRDCGHAESCGGGCRFRAGGAGPDRVMCAAYGCLPEEGSTVN